MSGTTIAFAVGFVSLLLTASPMLGQPRSSVAVRTADLSGSLEATVALAGPAVVEILATSVTAGQGIVPHTAELVRTQRGSGSGVIVDPDGYIVTNAHVVRGARRIRVELTSAPAGRSILATAGRVVEGQIIGVDLETDLAVIKVEERNLPTLAFGDSDELKAGQVVLAFGSPLGFHNSVSLGLISAVARQLEAESPMIYVQTDAPINPGSSGGPLVDLHGKVVGINTLIMSESGRHQGVGFAAPSNIVRTVYQQIRQNGRVRRGDIGIRAQTVTPVLASGLNLPRDHGVVLSDVLPRSLAAQAGLLPGDLVLTLDGKPMENGRQLQVGLYRRFAGDIVTLEILRNGEIQKVTVAMTERDDPFAAMTPSPDPRQNLVSRLGILGVNLDQRIAVMLPVRRVTAGVVVASTVADALDSRDGGLAPGDVIHAVNRTPVTGLAELRAVVDGLRSGNPVVLQLERRGVLMYLAFTVE